MTPTKENNQQLHTFFSDEYQHLKAYVHRQIENSADRDAEDIIQEVALSLFSRKNVLPINNIAGFVYRAIRNKIIDTLRKKAKNIRVESSIEQSLELSSSLENPSSELSYTDEIHTELKKAIQSLKPHYKSIITAIDIEGYTYTEIAKETGIPIGTLMSRRHRALSILQQKLAQQKITF